MRFIHSFLKARPFLLLLAALALGACNPPTTGDPNGDNGQGSSDQGGSGGQNGGSASPYMSDEEFNSYYPNYLLPRFKKGSELHWTAEDLIDKEFYKSHPSGDPIYVHSTLTKNTWISESYRYDGQGFQQETDEGRSYPLSGAEDGDGTIYISDNDFDAKITVAKAFNVEGTLNDNGQLDKTLSQLGLTDLQVVMIKYEVTNKSDEIEWQAFQSIDPNIQNATTAEDLVSILRNQNNGHEFGTNIGGWVEWRFGDGGKLYISNCSYGFYGCTEGDEIGSWSIENGQLVVIVKYEGKEFSKYFFKYENGTWKEGIRRIYAFFHNVLLTSSDKNSLEDFIKNIVIESYNRGNNYNQGGN